jgi:hypothetical protein
LNESTASASIIKNSNYIEKKKKKKKSINKEVWMPYRWRTLVQATPSGYFSFRTGKALAGWQSIIIAYHHVMMGHVLN